MVACPLPAEGSEVMHWRQVYVTFVQKCEGADLTCVRRVLDAGRFITRP